MPSIPDKSTRFVIRLAYHGCKFRPFYRIVAMPNRRPRNAKPTEQLGSFDPIPNTNNERIASFNYDKILFYIQQGAHVTKPVAKLLGLAGFYPVYPTMYIDAKRIQKSEMNKEYDITAENETDKEVPS